MWLLWWCWQLWWQAWQLQLQYMRPSIDTLQFTHTHTHTFTHQGAWSCSANAVLQDAVIIVRAVERVKTLRSEISIAGWDLTVQREKERGDERTRERWCFENKNKKKGQAWSRAWDSNVTAGWGVSHDWTAVNLSRCTPGMLRQQQIKQESIFFLWM